MSSCLLWIFVLFIGKVVCEIESDDENGEDPTCSTSFHPTNYDIELRPILDENEEQGVIGTAPGKVWISGMINCTTNLIILDVADNLFVNLSSTQVVSGSKLIPSNSTIDNYSKLSIKLENEVQNGTELKVYLEFTTVNETLHESGLKFFRDKNNQTFDTLAAVRVFEGISQNIRYYPIDFRCQEVFPCVNDQQATVSFDLKIGRKDGHISLSNRKLIASKPDPKYPGWVIDTFAPTKTLFAFVVGNLSFVEEHFGTQNKSIKVYAPSSEIGKAQISYIANLGSTLLTFYDDYFNSSAVEKMDLIIHPKLKDFDTLGIISLHKAAQMPPEDYKVVFNVLEEIAGPLATQWIRMMTDEDFWNSENSFFRGLLHYITVYLGYTSVDPRFSQICGLNQFYYTESKYLRMLEGVLSPQAIRQGLSTYINQESHPTKGLELWNQFLQILENFIEGRIPPGLISKLVEIPLNENPVVRVDKHNTTHFIVSQESLKPFCRFSKNYTIAFKTHVGWEDEQLSEFTLIMDPSNNYTAYVPGNSSQLILVDPDATGLFRVLYDDELFHRIVEQLNRNVSFFKPAARGKLLQDDLFFATQELCELETGFHIAKYLLTDMETDCNVLGTFLLDLDKIYTNRFLAHPDSHLFQSFFESKVEFLFLQIEKEPPSEFLTLTKREYGSLTFCNYGTPTCKNMSSEIFSLWKSKPTAKLSEFSSKFGGLREDSVACLIIRFGGESAFDFMFAKYQQEKLDYYESVVGPALKCVSEPMIIERLLNLLINPNDTALEIEGNSRYGMFSDLMEESIPGKYDILSFVTNNWDQVVNVIGNGKFHVIVTALEKLSWKYYSTEGLKELEDFVELHKSKLMVEGSSFPWGYLEEIYLNVRYRTEWMDMSGKHFLKWLTQS